MKLLYSQQVFVKKFFSFTQKILEHLQALTHETEKFMKYMLESYFA